MKKSTLSPNNFTPTMGAYSHGIKVDVGDSAVKAVMYVTDVSKFSEISAVRNKYFANSKPVSTLVEISKTVKEGCDVEIEVIAIKSNG